jgi:hypothetical protein
MLAHGSSTIEISNRKSLLTNNMRIDKALVTKYGLEWFIDK